MSIVGFAHVWECLYFYALSCVNVTFAWVRPLSLHHGRVITESVRYTSDQQSLVGGIGRDVDVMIVYFEAVLFLIDQSESQASDTAISFPPLKHPRREKKCVWSALSA